MSKSIRVVTLAVALVFVLASVAAAAPVSDTVIVKFKDGTSAGQRNDALDGADVGRTVGTVPGIGARVVRARGQRDRDRCSAGRRPRRRVRRGQPAHARRSRPERPALRAPVGAPGHQRPHRVGRTGPRGLPVRRRARRRHRRLRRAHDPPGPPGRDLRLPLGQHDRRGLRASPTAAARTRTATARTSPARSSAAPATASGPPAWPSTRRRSCARRSTPTTSASCPTSRPASSPLRDRGARIINLSLVGPASDTLVPRDRLRLRRRERGARCRRVRQRRHDQRELPGRLPRGDVRRSDGQHRLAPGLLHEQRRRRGLRAGRRHRRSRTTRATRATRSSPARRWPRRKCRAWPRSSRPSTVAERSRPALRDRQLRGRPRRARPRPGCSADGRIDAARAVAAAGASVGEPVEEPAPTPPPAEEPAPEAADQE